MIEIRTAAAADAGVLAELAAATFALACPPHTTAEAIAAFLRDVLAEANFDTYLADPQRMLFLAEDPDTGLSLGYTMVIFGEPADPDVLAAISIRPTVELSKCYLRAESHGRGVASSLMTATLDAARAREARGAWLGVNQENARAIRFYEKHGFARVGTKHFLVGDRYEDDFVLERTL
ncbi:MULTISPECIES: GNAT family N-acetyltransferase [unclassified Cryobacterium]|uniref:GNAT family N-acetyltransferase n=1 Tax=unclassified Cryobacterium TaxID=2649013 RepID=UPI002AB3F158|nr:MULTISPECIES: GNAT family N-acetyltransferase [unclassified Cryobacterium]MDY7541685.1 GNAT family N-acetyltransferase [Cryobacterium sp. 5B3]